MNNNIIINALQCMASDNTNRNEVKAKSEVRYMLKVFLLSSSSLTISMVEIWWKKDILLFGTWTYKLNSAWKILIKIFNVIIKKNFI